MLKKGDILKIKVNKLRVDTSLLNINEALSLTEAVNESGEFCSKRKEIHISSDRTPVFLDGIESFKEDKFHCLQFDKSYMFSISYEAGFIEFVSKRTFNETNIVVFWATIKKQKNKKNKPHFVVRRGDGFIFSIFNPQDPFYFIGNAKPLSVNLEIDNVVSKDITQPGNLPYFIFCVADSFAQSIFGYPGSQSEQLLKSKLVDEFYPSKENLKQLHDVYTFTKIRDNWVLTQRNSIKKSFCEHLMLLKKMNLEEAYDHCDCLMLWEKNSVSIQYKKNNSSDRNIFFFGLSVLIVYSGLIYFFYDKKKMINLKKIFIGIFILIGLFVVYFFSSWIYF